ncbi:MAG: CPBP family intramembrane metalloprotease [Bacteroidales bacterium]|nr:CPBP family intramembrane metalloprotease [Bacteroidales bacterium]
MFNREPILYSQSPPVKILSFLLIIFLSLLFTLTIGIAMGFLFYGGGMLDYIKEGLSLNDPSFLPMLRYLQIINTLGIFVFPSLIFALLASKSPARYLAIKLTPSFLSIVTGVAVIIAILPFIHWLAGFNEILSLPECLAGVEEWMKRSEEQAKELTYMFLGTTTVAGLLINLIMIAVLSAIGEEFLFRGVLLRLFREWTKNPHVAVLISAFLFSALHLQFYGFLPRLFLGIILGYLFIWTRSIWVPVLVHFVNNGIAVVAAWFYAKGNIQHNFESVGEVDQPLVIISSLVIVLVMMLSIRFYEHKKKGSTFG